MPSISPTLVLLMVALLSVMALGSSTVAQYIARGNLRKAARNVGFSFEPVATAELLHVLAAHLSAIGAADVFVVDVMNSPPAPRRISIARVDYVLGSVRHRRNTTNIMAAVFALDGTPLQVQTAPSDVPPIEQYRHLLALLAPDPPGHGNAPIAAG